MSANALAKALGVPTNRFTAILGGRRGITADTALCLSRYFGTTPQLWLNLQRRSSCEWRKSSPEATSRNACNPGRLLRAAVRLADAWRRPLLTVQGRGETANLFPHLGWQG